VLKWESVRPPLGERARRARGQGMGCGIGRRWAEVGGEPGGDRGIGTDRGAEQGSLRAGDAASSAESWGSSRVRGQGALASGTGDQEAPGAPAARLR
jgi:hypothetical protein